MSEPSRSDPSATVSAGPRTLPGAAFLFAVLSLLWGLLNLIAVFQRGETSADRIERLLTAILNFACGVELFRIRKFGLYLAYSTSVLFAASGVVDFFANPNDPSHAAGRFIIGLAWLTYFVVKRKLFST